MYTNEKTSDTVNELLLINNDRYQGYNKAAEETKDASLRSLFMKLGEQSLQFKRELQNFVAGKDHLDSPAYDTDKTKASGKLYRVWMDIKAALSGNDRKAILSTCEYGEDVALKNYDEALNSTDELQSDVLMTIQKQRSELKESHDMIKSLRDNSSNEKDSNWNDNDKSNYNRDTIVNTSSGMDEGNVTGTGLTGNTGKNITGDNADDDTDLTGNTKW